MSSPIKTAPAYSKFGSNDKLAKALIEKFPDVGWTLTPRSLAAKVGQLDKGNPTWWLTREKETASLAELLELPVADLGVQSQTSNHLFSFSGFPGLEPFDLKQEKPWVLAEAQFVPRPGQKPGKFGPSHLSVWLNPDFRVRPPYEFEWLYVGDDLERQLLVKSLAATGYYEVLVVENLADAAQQLRGRKPLIVFVSADGGEEDLMVLADRPSEAGLLVIAPFTPSMREQSDYWEWERMITDGREWRFLDLMTGSIKCWTWILFPDWRNRLLEGVEKRLNRHKADTLFSAQGVKNWLERFDAHAQWFSTTSDLMHLCQIGHSSSEKKLPAPNDPDAGKKLVKFLFKEKPQHHITQIQQLVEARWNRSELSWRGSLPMESWLSLAPPVTGSTVRNELDAIAQAKSLSERKKAADRVAKMLETGNADALLSSGLIKECVQGDFDFEHPTLAGLLVRDKLMRQIVEEPLTSWALACFDPERRRVVDTALDAVSIEHLAAAAERLLQEADSAVAIGASEALFMAVGRRILDGKEIPAALMLVAQSVVDRIDLTTVEWELPNLCNLLSRPVDSKEEELAWITACWAWSLLPKPSLSMPDNWLFPGWSQSLPKPPHWLAELWPDKNCQEVSPAWSQSFTIVDKWLKDMEQPIVDMPRILRIGFLAKAAQGACSADPAWWSDLLGCRWAEQALLKRFQLTGKEAAVRLWPSFFEFGRCCKDVNSSLRVLHSSIRKWLLETLTPADALDFLDDDDRWYLAQEPKTLPPAFRAPLLQSLLLNPRARLMKSLLPDILGLGLDAPKFLTRFGPSAAPALVHFQEDELLWAAAAPCLWRWNAKDAIRLLRHKEKLSMTARARLLTECPAEHVAEATAAVVDNPELFDLTALSYWARRHLPSAGRHAGFLVEILKMAQTLD
ncbi:MAG: hypothetical protein NTZ64_06225 [Polaromonas sp.]|nr:hypothetical protein [Polaromonas sp.]